VGSFRWDPRLAPKPHPLNIQRRRQCQTLPGFMSLVEAEAELQEKWDREPTHLQMIYLNWMAAPWTRNVRDCRIRQTLQWLRADRLAQHVQHPTILDAMQVADLHLYQPPPP
jgi:hypothetical protein